MEYNVEEESENADTKPKEFHLTPTSIISGFFGLVALAGVVTTIDPRSIPLFYDIIMVLLFLVAILSIVAIVVHTDSISSRLGKMPAPLKRIADVVENNVASHVWLVIALIIGISLMAFWEKPTAKQIAQQILDARGMRIEPEYYQIALEAGNDSAIRLFHQAGFSPEMAYTRFVRPGQTNESRLTIDILLDHPYDVVEPILREIGTKPDKVVYGLFSGANNYFLKSAMADESAINGAMAYPLLNTPIIHNPSSSSDSTASVDPFFTGPTVQKKASINRDKFSMVDRAVRNNREEATLALLTLGSEFDLNVADFPDWNRPPEVARLMSLNPRLLLEMSQYANDAVISTALEQRFPPSPVLQVYREIVQSETLFQQCDDNRFFEGYVNTESAVVPTLVNSAAQGQQTQAGSVANAAGRPEDKKASLMTLFICDTTDETGEILGLVTIKNLQLPFYYKRLNYLSGDIDDSNRDRYGTLLLTDPEGNLVTEKLVSRGGLHLTLAGALRTEGDFRAANEDVALRVMQTAVLEKEELGAQPVEPATATDAAAESDSNAGALSDTEYLSLLSAYRSSPDIEAATSPEELGCNVSSQPAILRSGELYSISCDSWVSLAVDEQGMENLDGTTSQGQASATGGSHSALMLVVNLPEDAQAIEPINTESDYYAIALSDESIRLAPGRKFGVVIQTLNGNTSDTTKLKISQAIPDPSSSVLAAQELVIDPDVFTASEIHRQPFPEDSNSLYLLLNIENAGRLKIALTEPSNDIDMTLSRRGASEALISSENPGTSPEDISYDFSEGQYLLRLQNYPAATASTFDFSIAVDRPKAMRPPTSENRCFEYSGTSSGDGDLSTFQLQEPANMEITLTGVGSTDIDLELRDRNGNVLESSTSTDSEEVISRELSAGLYTNRVYYNVSDYQLTVCPVDSTVTEND